MATQLTRDSVRNKVSSRLGAVSLSPRALAIVLGLCLVVAFGAVIASNHNARRDEAAARFRYENAQALVALPPASNDSLKDDLAVAQQQLATAQAGVGVPSVDPASDALTALLVRTAGEAGLSVKGVSRADGSQANIASIAYSVQGLHITVSGRVEQIDAFLSKVSDKEPALIATLTSMTTNEAGIAQAEIVFSAYAKVPTPTVVPVATPKVAR